MKTIKQLGNENQASLGDNSPNIKQFKSSISVNILKKAGWFTGGFITSMASGIVIELLKSGKTSEILNFLIGIFK